MYHKLKLAFSFAKRDFKERYVGTKLGQFWFIISPIIMITIYSIIFSGLMKLKLNIADNTYAYSVYIIPGIVAWTAFSTMITRQSNIFTQKANFIKKIAIPIYIYQIAIAITEFFIFALSFILAIGFLLLVEYPLSLSFLYLLPVMLLQLLFSFSLGIIISLFVPFIKDLKVVIPIVMQLWFWITPIIYMKEITASKYPLILTLNPFYHFVHLYQDIFLYGKAPQFESLSIIFILSITTFLLAIFLYKKMISTIKDII